MSSSTKRPLRVSLGPCSVVSVWVNRQLLDPAEYRVNERAGTVTLLKPMAGQLSISCAAELSQPKRRQAQWKKERQR